MGKMVVASFIIRGGTIAMTVRHLHQLPVFRPPQNYIRHQPRKPNTCEQQPLKLVRGSAWQPPSYDMAGVCFNLLVQRYNT